MAKTPQQQAAELVQQSLGPQIAAIQEAARNEGAGAQAAYGAAAQMQQGIAPAIQGTYGMAAAQKAVIDKGLQIGAQLAAAETSGAANAQLAQNNSPQQVKAADISGILGSLGSLGAGNLLSDGAAMTSAARFLPTRSLNLGVDAVKAARSKGTAGVAALEARRPELMQGALAQIQDNAAKQRAGDQNEIALRAKLGDAEFNRLYKTEKLKQGGQSLNLRAADLKLKQSKQRFDQLLSKAKLDLDVGDYDLAVERERRLSKPKKKGGFTAKQRQDLSQTAFETAADDFYGYYDKDTGKDVPPRPPVEALRDLIASGVPFSVAIKAIQRFARGKKEPSQLAGVTAVDEKGREVPMWALWKATLGWSKAKKK